MVDEASIGGAPEDAPLSAEVREMLEWIEARWTGQQKCPISGHSQWWISTELGGIQRLSRDEESMMYTVVMLVCVGCGYTLLFNSAVIRATKDKEAQETSSGGEHGK